MALVLTGCSQSINSMACEDVEAEAVRVSNGALIKITDGRETSRSEDRLICHGIGVYAQGGEVRTRYQAYVDSDDELMVAYDTDEATTAEMDAIIEDGRRQAKEAYDSAVRDFQTEYSNQF